MAAVVALAAADVGSDDDTVANLQRNGFKVCVEPVAADGCDRSDILMSLDDGKGHRPRRTRSSILADVALVSVFVRPTDSGDFHLHQHTTGRGIRQRILADLVMTGFD